MVVELRHILHELFFPHPVIGAGSICLGEDLPCRGEQHCFGVSSAPDKYNYYYDSINLFFKQFCRIH